MEAHDRTSEDLCNIVGLEHVNVEVPDQRVATAFYVTALGLTRDPYLVTGTNNMWVNVGRNQFHLPTGGPQVLRGHVGLVLPDRTALLDRLATARGELRDTLYRFEEHDDFVETVSPWGNVIRCYEPHARFGPVALGIAYVEFTTPRGTAAKIADFYRRTFSTRAAVDASGTDVSARCVVGHRQHLVFRETDAEIAEYDNHHVQVYLLDFSGPHERLRARDLVTEESNQWQYRFRDIVDLETGNVLFSIEHEVRSMTHPLYARHLVNRDPSRTNRNFSAGHEDLSWALD